MFCQFNNKIVNTDIIKYIVCSHFLDHGYVYVHYVNSYETEIVNAAEALQLIMQLYPSVLEGKRGRYWKNQWVIHNLIGHPLMQIFSWLYLRKLAVWIHEATVPRPKMPIKRQ
jgi:hypothetical protein